MMMSHKHVSQQTAGIEKKMSWRLMFFVAALCTLAGGGIAVFDLVKTCISKPAPMAFMSELFLVIFGIIMVVLDFPFGATSATANMIRDSIYKYMLFLTRFTGRGLWYCFLGTMIFSALWDLDISWFLGLALGLYVILLGLLTMFKGIQLSMKLDMVRKQINDRDVVHATCPEQGWSKQGFTELINSIDALKFNEDDIDYIVNALSFTPESTGVISKAEYTWWLSPGSMSIV